MVGIKIQCPNCKHQLTVEGKPTEKIYVTCPKCKTYGTFTFPAGKCDPNKVECFIEEGDVRFKKLRIFNGVMGCLHVIQGLLMLFLSNAFTLPMTYSYPFFNTTTQTIGPVSHTLIDVPYWSAGCAFLVYFCNRAFPVSNRTV